MLMHVQEQTGMVFQNKGLQAAQQKVMYVM